MKSLYIWVPGNTMWAIFHKLVLNLFIIFLVNKFIFTHLSQSLYPYKTPANACKYLEFIWQSRVIILQYCPMNSKKFLILSKYALAWENHFQNISLGLRQFSPLALELLSVSQVAVCSLCPSTMLDYTWSMFWVLTEQIHSPYSSSCLSEILTQPQNANWRILLAQNPFLCVQ